MNKNQKRDFVSRLKQDIISSPCVVLFHYRGMSDKQLYQLRSTLKSKKMGLKIAKNTLVKVAFEGEDIKMLEPYLSGPTAIAYSDDPVSLAKIISNTSKEVEFLKVQVGYLNKSILSKDAIDSLSKLGSLEDVRASLLGVLTGAQSKFVRVINAPASGVVALLNNYSSSRE